MCTPVCDRERERQKKELLLDVGRADTMASIVGAQLHYINSPSGVARAIELVGHHCACAKVLTTPTT